MSDTSSDTGAPDGPDEERPEGDRPPADRAAQARLEQGLPVRATGDAASAPALRDRDGGRDTSA